MTTLREGERLLLPEESTEGSALRLRMNKWVKGVVAATLAASLLTTAVSPAEASATFLPETPLEQSEALLDIVQCQLDARMAPWMVHESCGPVLWGGLEAASQYIFPPPAY